jgi:uncharacterized protein YraI
MRLSGFLAAAVLLAVPTAALAAPGLVTTSVSMRAGPGPGFPAVDRIPGGAHVNIHGCIRGASWCDVSWSDERGWVAAEYLEYYYRNRYVLLPDYVDVIDIPIVPFALDTYWTTYYSHRPWFHRLAYWNNYWRSHARFATQLPAGRSARGVETRAAIARQPIGQRGSADVRGARADRFAHENRTTRGFNQGIRETRQPIAGARARFEGNRFSAAPTQGRLAQPNVGRPGGAPVAARPQPSPLAAHAQMGGPRPMAGPPGGGAPHINAAPRAGGPSVGGGAAGGPPGRHHQ